MKKYKFILTLIIVGIFSTFFISCKKNIDFDETYGKQKLVVNSIFNITDYIDIYLTESRNPTIPSKYFYSYADAQISVFSSNNKILDFTYDDGREKYSSNEKPNFKVGETYSLVVTSPKYGQTSASFSFPGKTLIDSIELKQEMVNIEDEGVNEYIVAYIHFKDPEGEKNFYQIDGYYEKEINHFDTRQRWEFLDYYYQVDDVLKNNGTIDSYDNMHQIFNDDIFDGKDYTLKYLICYPYDITSENPIEVHFSLKSISQDLYYYYKSLDIYDYNDGDFTVEPTNIYNNIENGLGIIGTYQVDNKSATYPEN